MLRVERRDGMRATGDHNDGHSRIRDLVEARLGRPPQDKLEAAVVLEAWGGMRPPHALDIAADAVDHAHDRPGPSVANPRAAQPRDKTVMAEGLSLLIAVVAVALWTLPFGRALGTEVWDGAVRLALPITLGLQWLLRSRYLGRPNGLQVMRRDWPALAALVAVAAALAIMLGARELVAVLLIVTWVGGTVLVRRGWGLVYVVLLVIVAVEVNLGVPPLSTLTAVAVGTLVLAAYIVATAGSANDAAGRPSRAVAAGLLGAGIGGLLVLDTSIGWGTEGVLPALALVPSTAGAFWGGYHLWRFYDEVPRALAGVPVAEADRIALRGPAIGVLGGAIGRLVATTAVLSALAMLAASYLVGPETAQRSATSAATAEQTVGRDVGPVRPAGDEERQESTDIAVATPLPTGVYAAIESIEPQPRAAANTHGPAGRSTLLVGFGLIALSTLLISLLQSLGFASWALFTLACGLAAEVGMTYWDAAPFNGIALVTGAAVAVLVAIPPIISLFLRPGRVLATILWIS
jgi:hypothetical protein